VNSDVSTLIDVTAGGAVHLGRDITCDGFSFEAQARIQTHVHEDHMDEFDSSKGFQHIFMSEATRSLLIAEKNADLPVRDNVVALPHSEPRTFGDSRITLLSSGHMLGSVQALVEHSSGVRLGYSGDFSWPQESTISVDGLVVDSTYGNPGRVRQYTQAEVEEQLYDLVRRSLRLGPIELIAHRGTIQRALQILNGIVEVPILSSKECHKETAVYRDFGYCLSPMLRVDSLEGLEARRSQNHIRVYTSKDRKPVDSPVGTRIVLSAFMSSLDTPILEYSSRSFQVALSDHADFNGTLDYVAATGARYVVTDNTRGGQSVSLAQELQRRLGIQARPSMNRATREWGQS
jgi:putative mRNA 3-end processing factor